MANNLLASAGGTAQRPAENVRRKVLYVCHNHPRVMPGGAEVYALEVHEAMRASSEFEPIFLAHAEPDLSAGSFDPGSPFRVVNGESSQYFFDAKRSEFDFFYMTSRNKEIATRHFHEFLLAHRPDVIHFQHTLYLGYDLLRVARNTLPDAAIVYTLHEYLPICHRQGQMVRTHGEELCEAASPRRCHECFPEISPQAFLRRQRFIQSQLAAVDLFLAPSRFLLERYVEWGIPREKIRFEEYGRRAGVRLDEPVEQRPRSRLGFFGQLTPFKGIDVLLKAMRILEQPAAGDRPELHGSHAHLWVHGANLELQRGGFQNEVKGLLEASKHNVTFVGRYDQAELPRLMANVDWVVVPSIWWENSPLVIQEAFMCRRPVICSDIGGMAEKVIPGTNGLHFSVGDPVSLARTIHRAVNTPGLWQTLCTGIPQIYRMSNHVATLSAIYESLLRQTRPDPENAYAT